MFAQVNPHNKYLRSIIDTVWLYPMTDIQKALGTTSVAHTFDGMNIICSSFADITELYSDIFNQTTISQPVGNTGFSLGVGSVVEDFGKEIYFKLSNGMAVIHWRLVKQITPQAPATVIPVPGNSPNETVGFITVWTSFGNNNPAPSVFDLPLVTRLG
jgi:hypothetical protein